MANDKQTRPHPGADAPPLSHRRGDHDRNAVAFGPRKIAAGTPRTELPLSSRERGLGGEVAALRWWAKPRLELRQQQRIALDLELAADDRRHRV